jgi:hypothetical protein
MSTTAWMLLALGLHAAALCLLVAAALSWG